MYSMLLLRQGMHEAVTRPRSSKKTAMQWCTPQVLQRLRWWLLE